MSVVAAKAGWSKRSKYDGRKAAAKKVLQLHGMFPGYPPR
jgi:hypothetical protein